jgi:CheY-like chemotaxis protein
MGMVLADPAQAETTGTVEFHRGSEARGPAPNIAGIPRAIDNGPWNMGRIRKTPGLHSRSGCFGPTARIVNNSRLGGLAREAGDPSVNFTALVVEDDTLQRETLADLLKDEGMEVIECTSAEAAELVVASTGTELKALVTDVSLSGEMSGVELAQYAKRKFPHINVVVVSGRSPAYIPQDASFLLKAYRPRELLDAVLL